jgi:cobalt-zinc-cadmium efflux system outer membrane protein
MVNRRHLWLKPALLAVTLPLLAVALSACAALPAGQDQAAISGLLLDRKAVTVGKGDEALAQMMAKPMTLNSAVQMAIVKSPSLGLIYGQLGLDQADVLEAIEIANPRLGLSSLRAGGAKSEAQSLTLPIADLILMPARLKLAQQARTRARYQLASALLDVQLDVEAAWYQAVAAEQAALMRNAVASALQTSADLAERYFNAGNITELDLSHEQAAASQALIAAQQADVSAKAARANLDSLIGLSPTDPLWALSAALPLPTEHDDKVDELQSLALTHNLSLMAADQDLSIWHQVTATRRATWWLGDTALGLERERDPEGVRASGPSLDLELPIFNQGQAKTARLNAMRDLAKAQSAQIRLNLSHQIAARADELQRRRQVVALHSDGLIPQRQTIVARSQEQQNYMLLGVFGLIEAKTREYEAYEGYIEAVRDFWLARVELTRLVGSRLPSTPDTLDAGPSASDILEPSGSAPMTQHDHDHAGQS